ncbi:hypothetical protein LTR84_005557 [Exophiala bonariae]|uniref:MARVEL domain-containing protein n=1 Tax=Exophiala bonariae TaxID=1690606 RepID=A0AAV9N8A2_9EURO|nr:hypothetical protein LTR84_005557 [Exophiala bonariae]
MADISSSPITPVTVAGHDGRSPLPSILKPPAYATVDDDLEFAMPRPSRAVSFSERAKRSMSPPARRPSLYDLVRPPTPIPQDIRSPQQQQPRAPRSVRALPPLGEAAVLIVESIALGVVVFAAHYNLAWTCQSPWFVLPVVFLGTHACVLSLTFVLCMFEFSAQSPPEPFYARPAWVDVVDVLVPVVAAILGTVVFYAMAVQEQCVWSQ